MCVSRPVGNAHMVMASSSEDTRIEPPSSKSDAGREPCEHAITQANMVIFAGSSPSASCSRAGNSHTAGAGSGEDTHRCQRDEDIIRAKVADDEASSEKAKEETDYACCKSHSEHRPNYGTSILIWGRWRFQDFEEDVHLVTLESQWMQRREIRAAIMNAIYARSV